MFHLLKPVVLTTGDFYFSSSFCRPASFPINVIRKLFEIFRERDHGLGRDAVEKACVKCLVDLFEGVGDDRRAAHNW